MFNDLIQINDTNPNTQFTSNFIWRDYRALNEINEKHGLFSSSIISVFATRCVFSSLQVMILNTHHCKTASINQSGKQVSVSHSLLLRMQFTKYFSDEYLIMMTFGNFSGLKYLFFASFRLLVYSIRRAIVL